MRVDETSRRAFLVGSLAAAVSSRSGTTLAQGLPTRQDTSLLLALARHAEALPEIQDDAFGAMFDRLGEAKVVLLGESTHGTSEFYRARAAITRRLITHHSFTVMAAEADWPDAAHVDAYIRGRVRPPAPEKPFRRFPTWMWRNEEMRDLVDWLRAHNEKAEPSQQAGFYGLDLYSTSSSIEAVMAYVGRADPQVAAEVRGHYACLASYGDDVSDYATDLIRPGFDSCADEVAAALRVVTAKPPPPGDEAHFETLLAVLEARGPDAKAVVWAHNTHVGNASATDMRDRGETNIGELCRKHFGDAAHLVGFGTDRGTVMAASRWGAAPEVKIVRPSLPESYGSVFRDVGPERFLLNLRTPGLREVLRTQRLQRAIGVLYLPETERLSHYFDASLSDQFDTFVFLEETRAVTPVTGATKSLPADHPFG
jgi:erythromycin esterase-like protein